MSTIRNEALENIRNEMKGITMTKNTTFLEDKFFLSSLNPLQLKIVEMAREIYEDYKDVKECEKYIEPLKEGKLKTYSLEEAKKITTAKAK